MSKHKGNGAFSYDKYQQKKLQEQMRIRQVNANNQFREKWVEVVMKYRHRNLEGLAKFFFPPPWDTRFVGFTIGILEIIVRNCIALYHLITYQWMIAIHNKIFLWGITKKITTPKPGYRKIVIKVHGKVVEELEIKV